MRTICCKELRENYLWALLALLGLGFAQRRALHQGEERYPLGYNCSGNGLLLNSAPLLAVTTFGCAAVDLLLEFVQVLPELRRDHRASLLRRPIPRGVIFGGKALAGLAFYAGAALLPFAASVAHVAWPSKFATPVVSGLLLPGLQALAGGVAYYFGSLLLCLH